MRKNILFLLIFTVLQITIVSAQTTFRKVYPAPVNQSGIRILPTADQQYLLVSTSFSGSSLPESWLMKINKNGSSLWSKHVNVPGSGDFTFGDIIPCPDSGFLICGTLREPVQWNEIMILIKVDSLGDTLWTKQFPQPLFPGYANRGKCLLQLSDSVFLFGGIREDSDYYQILVIRKLDPNGNEIWSNEVNTGHDYTGQVKVTETENHSLLFYYYKTFGGPSVPDGLVLMTDSLGNYLWDNNGYAPPGYGKHMFPRTNGRYLFVGFTKDYWDDDEVHNYIFTYDTTGLFSNPVRYDLGAPANAMVQTPDTSFAMALGFYYMNAQISYRFEIWKLDSNGIILWDFDYPAFGKESASDIILAHDGGMIAVGTTVDHGVAKIYAVKTDDEGNINSGNYFITASQTPCEGDTVTLSVQNASLYIWSNGATTQTIEVTMDRSYGVEIIDSAGNHFTPPWYQVHFNPLPFVSLGNDFVVCTGTIVNFDAGSGFSSYLWQDGSNGQQYSEASTIADTSLIAVTVTDMNGCMSGDSVEVIFQVCSSIGDAESKPLFLIYPNPAKGFLTVMTTIEEGLQDITFSIFDVTGRKVLQKELFAKIEKLDLGFMSMGIYQYKFGNANEGTLKSGKLVLE